MGIWTWWKNKREGPQQPIDPNRHEQVRTLCTVLQKVIELLDADGEVHWRDWMSTSLAALESNDLNGARHLRNAYGGMGSFNDLVIGQRMDGDHFSWTPDAHSANDKLDALRSQAYSLTVEILHPER